MKIGTCMFFLLIISLSIQSGEEYKFRIKLKDKAQTSFSIERPEDFLSERAIDRRKRQNIRIDESDLPVSDQYIKAIEDWGCVVIAKSKWVNTVSIHCKDSSIVKSIRNLGFVESADFVWLGNNTGDDRMADVQVKSANNVSSGYYGYGHSQIEMVKGQYLHEKGYEGQGMQIAVLDAGFNHMEENPLMDNISVLGTKDFVYEKKGETLHGFRVLSLLASNKPDVYVGAAPKAQYWLFRTEDERGESPVEEDYWIAAIEYADSVGVDLVCSSLGYSRFDLPFGNHKLDKLDGKTIPISQAAEMAVKKGIFVVNCAGNERGNDFGRIVPPSDAEHVLTVGSVNKDAMVSWFSSPGLTADNRIKPDLVALGEGIGFIDQDGSAYISQGTSYSTPLICGMVACLWQAYPKLTTYELLDIMRRSGHKYTSPDANYGYGIPDMELAFKLAGEHFSSIEEEIPEVSYFRIIPFTSGCLRIINNRAEPGIYSLSIITLGGKIILRQWLTREEEDFYIPYTYRQVYIVNIKGKNMNFSQKVIF